MGCVVVWASNVSLSSSGEQPCLVRWVLLSTSLPWLSLLNVLGICTMPNTFAALGSFQLLLSLYLES